MEDDVFIIDARPAPDDFVRICDCCNSPLSNDEGICLEKCHITEWGLICAKHLGKQKPLKTYLEGDNLRNEWWF